jgi:hypothetical protein
MGKRHKYLIYKRRKISVQYTKFIHAQKQTSALIVIKRQIKKQLNYSLCAKIKKVEI